MENYLGKSIYGIIVIFVLFLSAKFVKNEKTKKLFIIRLSFFLLLCTTIFLLYLIYIFKLDINSQMNNENFKTLVDLLFYRYNLGLIVTYLFYLIFKYCSIKSLYYGSFIVIFISFSVLCLREIIMYIRKKIGIYKEKKRLQKEKELLLGEEMAIQKILEENEQIEKKEEEKLDDTSL